MPSSDVNSRNLPSQSKIITYFSERAKRPTAYDFMGTFPNNASGKRPDFTNLEGIDRYNIESPTSSIGSDTPPLTSTPKASTSQLDFTPKVSTSKLPETLTSDEAFNPSFDD